MNCPGIVEIDGPGFSTAAFTEQEATARAHRGFSLALCSSDSLPRIGAAKLLMHLQDFLFVFPSATCNQKELAMKSLHRLSCLAVFASLFAVAGCANSDPSAGIPKEKVAPAPTDLGSDPEYVKQFGSKKK